MEELKPPGVGDKQRGEMGTSKLILWSVSYFYF